MYGSRSEFRLEGNRRTRRPFPWDDTIIYELHVRGYTKLHPLFRIKLRGTYAGLVAQEVSLITSSRWESHRVELLPIHTFINDSHLLEKGLTNYWGYNTIGFFAPDPRYAARRTDSLFASSRRWSRGYMRPAWK